MNQRLNKLDMLDDLCARMSNMEKHVNKLDMLDDLCARMSNMEKHVKKLDNDILDIRNDLRQQSQRISDGEFHYNIVETRVSAIESDKDQIQWESIELREKRLEMQTHSMKYNLIFSGIHESEDRQAENCETTIKNFINKDLGVEGDVEFQNVHRLRQRVDRKPRNIIVKFTKYTDHEKVRTAAFEKFKGRKDFVVFQQYPAEISARRKELIPQMHALKREGRQV